MSAPVQLVTIGVDNARVPESVIGEFQRLQDSGTVRVLDVLFVQHTGAGDLDTVERLDAAEMHFDGSLLTELLIAPDAVDASPGESPVWSLQGAVPVGEVAALVLVEHLWAGPLVSAMLASGAHMLDELWLSEADRGVLATLLAGRE